MRRLLQGQALVVVSAESLNLRYVEGPFDSQVLSLKLSSNPNFHFHEAGV